MDFWSRIDQVRRECNVLEHSFYKRWSCGELSREELSFYAGEYRHAVVALSEASHLAAVSATDPETKDELTAHAREEHAHIDLWDRFAGALNADTDRPALPESAACAEAWTGRDRDLAGHLVALYAIEACQPAISETKAEGLREFYGFVEGPATAYFDIHARRDIEHADDAKRLLSEIRSECDDDRLVEQARSVLQANWRLLDGVERAFAGRVAIHH